MCVFIFAGDHPEPDISYFVFCIYTKVIFLKVNKPMLSMSLQNISDLFTAVWVSATIPTRTRQWGYTHLGDTREERKVQSCLRYTPCTQVHTLAVYRAAGQCCSPTGVCPQLSTAAEHHPGAAESHKMRTATSRCKSNFSVPTVDSKNLGWKAGIRKLYSVHNFLFHWYIHKKHSLPSAWH